MEKLNLLSLPEKAITGGGVLMLIASFFDWWQVDVLGTSFGESGWGDPGSLWSILAILLSIVLAGVVLAIKLGNMQMPALPQGVTWGTIFGGGAAIVVVFMLLKAWRIMNFDAGGFGIGFFIAIVATVAIAYGGYTIYTQEKAGVTNH